MENPIWKWMISRGTPMTQETPTSLQAGSYSQVPIREIGKFWDRCSHIDRHWFPIFAANSKSDTPEFNLSGKSWPSLAEADSDDQHLASRHLCSRYTSLTADPIPRVVDGAPAWATPRGSPDGDAPLTGGGPASHLDILEIHIQLQVVFFSHNRNSKSYPSKISQGFAGRNQGFSSGSVIFCVNLLVSCLKKKELVGIIRPKSLKKWSSICETIDIASCRT